LTGDFLLPCFERRFPAIQNRRLLLFAEMKLPGEAWLEFKIMKKDNKQYLRQTATFRPKSKIVNSQWAIVNGELKSKEEVNNLASSLLFNFFSSPY
jgi:hypothetical protein